MTLPPAAFERGVRRLDGSEARGLVADLLDARGRRTAVEGRVVTATDGTGGSTRLLVVDGPLAAVAGPSDRRVDAVLVTGGRVARALWSAAIRTGSSDGSVRPTVLGPGTLYEWFAYAVDGETRATLEDRYLGATEPSVLERGTRGVAAVVGGSARRLDRLPAPSRRVLMVVLVALFALVAATTAGPSGLLASTGSVDPPTVDGPGSPTPRLTAVPATATPVATATEAGPPLPDVCPPAPIGAHPASLRPAVRRTATAGGLDGWQVLLAQNLTEYDFDPNDQQAELVPELRHVAVFERPGGTQYRLGLDRWASPALAADAVARGGPWGLGFLWGAYTVWVEWEVDDTGGATAARHLLAGVRTPEGIRVGDACVSALGSGPAATASP